MDLLPVGSGAFSKTQKIENKGSDALICRAGQRPLHYETAVTEYTLIIQPISGKFSQHVPAIKLDHVPLVGLWAVDVDDRCTAIK
jgi:hypothetical protein